VSKEPGREILPRPSLQVPGARSEEDRREVTVVFADICESTALAERLDPEEWRLLLGRVLRALAQEIRRYGGTVDKYIGDAAMAVFGAPVALERHAERAIDSALAMRRAFDVLNREFEREYRQRLGLRIGICTGEVVAGVLEQDVQLAYTVVGDTVHTAQRVEAAAPPGEIYVTDSTYQQARDAFAFEPLAPLSLKGRSQPVRAFRVLSAISRDASTPPADGLRLIGRDDELTIIVDRLSALEAGLGHVLLILGDAGIGKSHLISEARALAPSKIQWHASAAVLDAGSYGAIASVLRAACGVVDGAEPAVVIRAIEATVRRLFDGDAVDIARYLSALLAPSEPEARNALPRELEGDALRAQIYRSVRRLLQAAAHERPVGLLFDDAHGFDDASLRLIEHLLPLVQECPLVICVISRAEPGRIGARVRDASAILSRDRYTELRLNALSEPAARQLLLELLPSSVVPERLADAIIEQAEGNPFFLQELVRAVFDARDEAGRSPRVLASEDLRHLQVPGTLRGVLQARLDRLDENLASVLKVASVVGRSFSYELLSMVVDDSSDLERSLDQLEIRGLIRSQADGIRAYAFTSGLTQDVAFESLLHRQRRVLHDRVGSALEQLYRDRLDDVAGILAFHFARAEKWERAQLYLFRAAEHAARFAADGDALAKYAEAVRAHQEAFGDRWTPAQRAHVERKIAEAHARRGDHAVAIQHIGRGLVALGSRMPTSRRGVRLRIATEILRHVAQRPVTWIPRRWRTSALDPAVEEHVLLYEALGWIDYYANRERLIADVLAVLNIAERANFDAAIVRGSLGAGVICDAIPIRALALAYHRRTVRAARRVDSSLALAYGHLGLAYHTLRFGPWLESLEHWRSATESFWRAGNLRFWAASLGGVGWLEQHLGHTDTSAAAAERMLEIGRDAADEQIVAWALHLRGTIAWQHGAFAAAEPDLRRAIELLRRIPDYPFLASALGDLGLCYLRMARGAAARELLEEAAALVRREDIRGYLARARNGLVEAYLAEADLSTAGERQRWLAAARSAWHAARPQAFIERLAHVGLARWAGTLAWERDDHATARQHWRRGLEVARELGARFDEALTLREMGRRSGDLDALASAARLFANVGAEHEAAVAAELGSAVAARGV